MPTVPTPPADFKAADFKAADFKATDFKAADFKAADFKAADLGSLFQVLRDPSKRVAKEKTYK